MHGHSGAMRKHRTTVRNYAPEVWSFGPSRNDGNARITAKAATAPPADRSAARVIYPFPLPQLAARFSANDASPSDASLVCRRLACIRTSRA